MSDTSIYQKIWDADQNQNGVTPILAADAPIKADTNKGYVIVNEPDDFKADTKVFPEVMIPEGKQATYKLCRALFDNYNLNPNIPEEDLTGAEDVEIDAFINGIVDTETMKVAQNYYDANLSDDAWKGLIKEFLFTTFRSDDRSGFEHVFVGEGKSRGNGIGGYHFWYKYYLDDAGRDTDGNQYEDEIDFGSPNYGNSQQSREGKLTPEVVTLRYKWSPEGEDLTKPMGGFFVGCSPEGLVALTMARTKGADRDLPGVVINNAEYRLTLIRGTGNESRYINTFFPKFVKRLVSGNEETLPPPVVPDPRRPPSPTRPSPPRVGGNPAARSPLPLPAGTVRIITAFVNPNTRNDEGESVTLVNIGSSDVNLNGWKLLDGRQRNLDLDSELLIGQAKTFIVDKSRNNSFSLSNKKNDITLVDSSGTVIDKVTYASSDAKVQGTPLLF
jgi:poly(U)-specific endoribonuclease